MVIIYTLSTCLLYTH